MALESGLVTNGYRVLIGRAKALYELPEAKGPLFEKTEIHTRDLKVGLDGLPLSKKQKHSRDIVKVGRLLIGCQFLNKQKNTFPVECAICPFDTLGRLKAHRSARGA